MWNETEELGYECASSKELIKRVLEIAKAVKFIQDEDASQLFFIYVLSKIADE